MKLHLPTGLRAALIAALTAVGFTLTQAAAAETQLNVSPTEKTGGNANITWTGGESTLNSWKLTFNLTVTNGDPNDFFNISGNNQTAQAGWSLGIDGTTLRLANGGKGQTAVIALDNAFELNQPQPVTFQFERNVDETGVSLGTGTFTVIAGELTQTYTVESLTDTALVSGSKGHIWCNGPTGKQQLTNIVLYKLDDKTVKESGYTWNASEAGNSSWNLTSQIWLNEDSQPVSYVSGGNAFFTKDANYKTVTIGENISAGKISVSDNYTFTMSGSSALTASKLTIASGSTLTVNGTGSVSTGELINKGTLSIGSGARVASSSTPVEVAAGDTFTVTGAGILELATMRSKGGTINISSNLAVTGGGDGKGGNNQNGLCINGGTGGSINILGGVTTVSGAVYTGNGSEQTALNVGTGSENATLVTRRLELGDTNGNTCAFTIGEKGKVVITGDEDFRTGTNNPQKNTSLQLAEWNQVVTSTISGKLYAESATAFMSNDASSTVNIAGGTMAVKGIATTNATSTRAHTFTMDGGKLVLGDRGIAQEPGEWTISFANGEIGTYAGNTVVGRNFTTSGNLTFNTAMYTWTGAGATREIEAGEAGATITVSGNFTGDGTIIKTGDGTLVLAGNNNALTHTIDLQNGTLDVTNAVLDISGMGGITTKGYSDGQVTGNGFATMGGNVDVVAVGTGTTLSHEGVQVKFNGALVTMDDNGDVVLEDVKSLSTFYVNVDGSTESLANAITKGGGELTSIDLGDNTKLAADQMADLGTLVVRANASAEVELSNKTVSFDTVTVTTKDEVLTLTGAGTLSAGVLNGPGTISIGDDVVLSNTTATMGTAKPVVTGGGTLAITNATLTAELSDAWTGTVRVADTTKQDGNNAWIDTLANENSLVEFINFTGYDRAWASSFVQEIAANIKLTSDGANAAWNLSAFASTTYTMVVSGDWQGDGTFLMAGGSAGQSQAVEYKGDITNWTGSIEVNAPGMRRVTFSENATAVNVSLVNNGTGAFELVVNNAATFSKEVNVSKLTVNADKSATFQADTTVGQLAGSGSIVKTGTDTTMTVTAAASTGTDAATLDISVNEGTLKATAANALGSGPITVANGGTLDMTVGNVLGSTQTVSNSGNVIIHNTLTAGTINGGTLTLAGDFPNNGEILDVDDSNTGNGFSQGGVMHVYTPGSASLTGITDIVHGETHYTLEDVNPDGDISMSGADWSTYQLNGEAQYAVQAIMDYAAEHSGTLAHIMVNADDLELTNDSTTLKTSMLGGEHLAGFILTMADSSALEIDGNNAVTIYTAEGSSTISLTADATIGTVVAGDADAMAASTLTITGKDHTVLVDGLGVAFDSHLVIDEGVKVELLHDTSFTTIMNATVELKEGSSLVLNEVSFATVEGGTEATIKVTSDEYLPLYDPSFAEYGITGARITLDATANFDMGHVIDATSQVVNKGTGSLRDISTNEKYDELNALGGDIYISAPEGTDARTLTVGNLTLAADRTVAEDTGKTVSIKVTDTAKFGSGATVGAALTMAGGSTLDGSASLANHDLVLGAAAGDKLNIGDTLWGVLSGLEPEGTASLFTNVNALTLAGQGYAGPVDLTTIFSREGLNANKYSLSYDNDTVIVTRNKDNDRYWKGGNGTWNTIGLDWKDDPGATDNVAFANGYNAYFTDTTGGTVTLGDDITAASITVSGADYTFEPGDPARTLTVTDSVVVSGDHTATFNMALNGAEKLKLNAKDGGTLKLNEGGSVKTVQIGGGTVNVAASKTLTAGGVVLTGNGTVSGALSTASLTGTGTLTMDNGSLTFTADNLGNGVHLASKGNSAITAQGATLTFNESVANDSAGSVTFTGTFDVSNLSATDGAAVYVDGEDSANGFKKAQKIVSVITAGTAKNGASVTFTYNGQSRDSVSEQGKITFDGTTEYDKFYVNKSGSTEKVSTATGKFSPAPGTFVLADNTTLKVDENIAMSMVTVSGTAAKMVIDSGKTVTTDGTAKNLTLSGAGTLAVDTGKTATGVELDATNWTGTVSFTEAELATLSGAFTANSTVSLKGVTGSLGSDTVTGKLILNKGTGDWGFGQTATDDSQITTIAATITGDGNLGVKSGTVDSTFNLNGDINSWNGNFIAATDAAAVLNLTGDDTKTVHGTVSGSKLAVNVEANTSFEGALDVAEINVAASKTATLKSDSTAGRVNASGCTLKVDDGQTLTVTESAAPGGLLLGEESAIRLQGSAYLGGADYRYIGGYVENRTYLDLAVTIGNVGITVKDTTLWTTGNTAFTVNNNLENATFALENTLAAKVELNNVKDPLKLDGDLAIGATGSLKVANGTAKQVLNIGSGSTLTTSAGSVLDANVVINSGVSLDMDGALNMNGGALTLTQSSTLTGDLYTQIEAMEASGASVSLFTGVGALTLGDSAYSEPVTAALYFSNLGALSDKGDYWLDYDEGIVSIRFEATAAHTLTWNGTEAAHSWVQDDDTVTDWLEGSPAAPAYFQEGDNAKFTVDATVKTVTIEDDITARNITIDSPELYTFETAADHSITAQKFEMTGHNGLAKTGEGKLTLDVIGDVSLTDSVLSVQEGSVEIGTAAKSGKLSLQASALEIAEGAELSVATIEGDKTSSITLDGTLTVSGGTASGFETSEGSLLKIADVGQTAADTLYIESDTTLYGLENHGTLDLGMNTLSLMEKTEQGGNVTANKLNLAQNGNVFNALETNRVTYAYDSTGSGILDAETPNLVVDSIAPTMVIPSIALDVTQAMGEGGSLSAINRLGDEVTYTLIHANDQTLVAGGFTLVGEALLIQNGLLHAESGLWSDGNNLNLTVGGLDLTWYTDKDVTEWGYQVVSGDALTAGGDTLNGVEHVVVDASRKIDVTGAGSEPGLRVRNITGLDGRTITFSGTEDDTVNLITNEETASNVNVAAENIRVNVGLHELDDMDPSDYESLHLGGMSLTGSYLDVAPEADLTVGALNGDSGSLLNGELTVDNAGGSYRGSYDNAHVILESTANQALAAKRGLTMSGSGVATLTYSGKDAVMEAIHGHDGVIVVLNDPNTDNSGNTLTLNEASEITDGFAIIGMSAVASARTLDTEAAPVLLAAPSLDMSGSTLIINQTEESSTIAMAVNDGGYKSNLYLAGFGAEDTNADDVQLIGYLYNKYYTNARMQSGRVLVDRNRSFYTDITAPTTENGRAGAGMLDDALLYTNPQVTNPDGDLATVMTALETGGYTHNRADKVMAAMSGASQAAMGAAWNRDVDRQLRAIRNRTTQMGLAECTHHEGLPYFNAWINAEGDYTKLNGDGTLAGYKLSSWGGTVGVDVDCTARFTVGAAVTAMSGNFTAESMDQAEGDLNRLYVSVFGRYARRAWTHTLVATFGMADTKLKRTVNYDYGSYNTESSSDGTAFGVMYEVGYVTALNEDASTCLQPVLNLSYRHSSLGGATEQSASDAALRLGDVDANVFTAAIGARLQSAVGTSVYNRTSIFEGRVMLKFDAGDRDTTAGNGFIGMPGSHSTKSTEAGMFGVEVGAGLTIPLSENAGALFFDVTGDFRAKDTEINGTVGYRYNF